MASTIRGNDDFDSGSLATAKVLTATSGAALNAVGSYASLRGVSGGNDGYTPGNTKPGSELRHADSLRDYTNTNGPSGTWRCMGYTRYTDRVSLWLRIA